MDNKSYIKNHRYQFEKGEIDFNSLPQNPFTYFKEWIDLAVESKDKDAYTFVLSTIDNKSVPNARVLYLRDLIDEKLVFYTSYISQKANEIEEHPNVALTFHWTGLEKQVRIQGKISKAPTSISDNYFASRPRESQIGAWASLQSSILGSYEELKVKVEEIEKRFENEEVKRPEHWGGYMVEPFSYEFWQGRPNRLHQRVLYKLLDNKWESYLLNP